MTEYIIREYDSGSLPAMKELWHGCFEEKEEYVDAFLALLPQFGTALTALSPDKAGETRLCGAAYIIDDMRLLSGGREQRCALIYAVAVDRAFRRFGIGGELVRRTAALAKARGAELITILPAEASLYGWYERTAGFQCRLYRKRQLIEAAELAMPERIDALSYARHREGLLPGGSSLIYGGGALLLQEALCRVYGGGLYLCAGAIAAAYRDGDSAIIQELLCPEGHSAELIAAAIAHELGAEQAQLLSPGRAGDEQYLAALPCALSEDCYWPLAFD